MFILIYTFLLLTTLTGFAAEADLEVSAPTYTNNNHSFSIRRNQGKSIGTTSSYTTVEGFSFPIKYDNFWPFIDVRFHKFDHKGEHALNLGVGYRLTPNGSSQIYGLNVYYDHRRIDHSNFNQIGLGFEILGQIWGFRLNGYLPVAVKSHRNSFCFYDCYLGDYFFQKETFNDSLRGINFEIEALIATFNLGDIRLSIAPYYFHNKKGCRNHAFGSQFRLCANITQYFTANIIGSYDTVFKGQVQVQLGLTIPFNISDNLITVQNQNARLFRPVHRIETLVLKKRNRYTTNF